MSRQYQVTRDSDSQWTVTRIDELWDSPDGSALEYETAGRIVKDGNRYYAETAVFTENGVTFRRQQRGFLTATAAMRFLTDSRYRAQVTEKERMGKLKS